MVRTREGIIDAFRQLLDEKPINKITVKDIVTQCGINRNTFYYYFPDIPTLVETVTVEEIDRLIETYYRPSQPIDCVRPMMEYCLEHKRAVLHIYRYTDRAVFQTYLDRLAQRMAQNYFQSVVGKDSLSDGAVADLIHLSKCSMVGMVLDWLDRGMREDMVELPQRLHVLLESEAKAVLAKFEK